MREWILKNTTVTSEEYDRLINSGTINTDDDVLEVGTVNLTPRRIASHPLLVIDCFTLKKPSLLTCFSFGVKKNKKGYSYNGIKFWVLAELLNNMKDIQDVLYSSMRKGKCAQLSSSICMSFSDTSIATAMCKQPCFEEEPSFLHTFVISRKGNKEYVFDATFNIIMEKDLYLELFKGKIISVISREEYYSVCTKIAELNLGYFIRLDEYFCFPEQIKNGINKLIKKKL